MAQASQWLAASYNPAICLEKVDVAVSSREICQAVESFAIEGELMIQG
tara:strand:+ start:1120 stop:1263 length:144 start_codon:yes stop_codon:yes gene_type:complete